MNGEIRYDSKRVRLRTGEYEKNNGQYEYRYAIFGKQISVYDRTLEGLREKEEQILSQKEERNKKYNQYRTTLNDVFELWRELKRGSNLYHCLRFYKMFPEIVDTVCRQSGNLLSWSHYRALLQIETILQKLLYL